ncbi:MAG: MBOAT family protein [Candidatus Omnitrophica bacterium]|nr:MBOAT family protein [Candidatus Omnitrophota bacterium]
MLFNSIEFFIFFFIVYVLYVFLNHHWQNRMLLLASYYFYGSWDWRFLSLLWISTVVDFYCGRAIQETSQKSKRQTYLTLSIITNLGILGFFKYFNFFTANLQALFSTWGVNVTTGTLDIILPVGISFYTFQTMSYTIDIYYGKMKAEKSFLNFALFVAFFPQLVAGPIERAKRLLPQISRKRELSWDQFYQGCFLVFWGIYQKVFISDNLAKIVDPVFAAEGLQSGWTVLFALYAFAFQIFCDFAGYSNIARGLCRCMGFDIMVNFNIPYAATNPSQFWQRWHISLSSWLKDYLYIPLGGNRKGGLIIYRNLALTMILGGLWHGAAWTFIIWGLYQGLLLIIYRGIRPLMDKWPSSKHNTLASLSLMIKIVFFFHLTCLGWLIFRAASVNQINDMLYCVLFNTRWQQLSAAMATFKSILFYTGLLLGVQFFQYRYQDLLIVFKSPLWVRVIFYFICFYSVLIWGVTGGKEFIYFQF